MVARPGCKDTSMLISDIAFWLQLPPTAGGELSFFVVSCVDLYFLISETVPWRGLGTLWEWVRKWYEYTESYSPRLGEEGRKYGGATFSPRIGGGFWLSGPLFSVGNWTSGGWKLFLNCFIMTKVFLLVLRKEWMLSLYIYTYIHTLHYITLHCIT